MGEADGARMLVSAVDVDDFTPKMYQVAVQSALANADPSGLCPLEDGLGQVERLTLPLIRAMCASLSGSSAEAAADIENARRYGRIGGIDLALADKVVGAGADTSRASTIEWAQANSLTACSPISCGRTRLRRESRAATVVRRRNGRGLTR